MTAVAVLQCCSSEKNDIPVCRPHGDVYRTNRVPEPLVCPTLFLLFHIPTRTGLSNQPHTTENQDDSQRMCRFQYAYTHQQ